MQRLSEFEDRSVSPPVTYVNILMFDDLLVFRQNGADNFTPMGPRRYQLQRRVSGNTAFYYLMDPEAERVTIFRAGSLDREEPTQLVRRAGEVAAILDRNGNRLTFQYNADNLPTRIEDGLGRSLDLTYAAGAEPGARSSTWGTTRGAGWPR